MYLGMLTLVEKLKNIDKKIGVQRPADAETAGLRSGSQRNQVESLN